MFSVISGSSYHTGVCSVLIFLISWVLISHLKL